jgi:hypothetical protein
MGVWQVSYLAAAADGLDSLPALEQVAIQHAVEKLEAAGGPPASAALRPVNCAPAK